MMDQLIAGQRAWWIIAALAAIAALAGVFTVQPLDRDESRYAQATVQMLETGDFVEINFQDAPRHKKPVGIYWMQALTVGLLSDADARQIWAYRLPSVFGAMLAALGCFWVGTRLMSREAAFVAAALLAVSALLAAEGGIAKTDAILAGLTTMAMAALVQLRYGGGRSAALIFWAMLGLGVLVKGPITPMVAGLTVGALVLWERRVDWLKPLLFWPGPLLAAAIVLPWFIAIELSSEAGFIQTAFLDDLAPKLTSGDESHGAWPGYHLLLVPLLTIPFGFYLLPGLHRVWTNLKTPETASAARFLLAWVIPSWIVFELMPTKLPHYVLPLYPALALIAGLGWQALREAPVWSRYGSIAVGLTGGLLFAALMIVGSLNYGGSAMTGYVAAAIFGLLVLGQTIEVYRKRAMTALALAICANLGGHFLLRGVVIPGATDLNLSERAAAATRQMVSAAGETPVAYLSSYTEPSLVFALGTETRLLEFSELADAVSASEGPVISIEDSSRSDADIAALSQLETNVCAVQEVAGYNYSRGRETVLIVRLHNCEEGG
ncbi:glycosyltransferase family 39 protein [Hyphobacterium sp. CCMP332]|uniref:ArnT family glycosyltransferase n=1 Tax=Hyphobacterium sp. CCMP332 TaxID=2749086 RepID=UPI00164FD1E5|nr:glycosyltransferase family 39 protein [Hyphobacterium sp. CCMP332]QNL17985.1 glycosyltransferase family 39 protein [Hyphobacterium sp. CCMP332]